MSSGRTVGSSVEMLTDSGHFNPTWLAQQPNERLRYEAECEHIRNYRHLPRHTLCVILGQIAVVGYCQFGR
jgi:hypothetical protein